MIDILGLLFPNPLTPFTKEELPEILEYHTRVNRGVPSYQGSIGSLKEWHEGQWQTVKS
jgi:hypothetical protein